MTIHITTEQAIELMEAAVNDKGYDYVYPAALTCNYVLDGAPACLVGNALHRAGVPVEELVKLDSEDTFLELKREDSDDDDRDVYVTGVSIGEISPYLERVIDVTLDPGAVTVFMIAQTEQDSHETWGRALNEAKKLVNADGTVTE